MNADEDMKLPTKVQILRGPVQGQASKLTSRTKWILLLIVVLGTVARFFNQDWDQATGQHPDERHVLMSTWRLEWPNSLAQYFDEAHSPLNPRNREAHFFAYGTLPSTILRGVILLGGITRPEQMTGAARTLSALADVAVIALVFALAWTLYRRESVALLGALLYALAVLPIQHAHFFVVDPFANLFVALALVFLARGWRSGHLRDYAVTGIALGLALSCKISVATFGLPVGLVALISSARRNEGWLRILSWATLRVAMVAVITVVTVRIGLPDAFDGFWPWQLAPRWLANMREVVAMSTGEIDIVFTRQFYGRTPLVWPWWNMVVWGMGLGLGLAAWTGWMAATWKLLRQRASEHAVPVLWVAVVFFHLGVTYQATLRYFLPIYGCLCVLAAWWLVAIATRAKSSERVFWSKPWVSIFGKIVGVAVVVFTAGWAAAFLSIYAKPYTRAAASKWIYENIPAGSTLACEHWDDWLPLAIAPGLSPTEYHQIEFPLYVADSAEKRGELLSKLNSAEYIIIASQKLRDSIPRMPHRYPFTISYYQGLEDGSLGFDRVAEFSRKMNFFGWMISTRSAEEAFSVYDHPPVAIYKKSAHFEPEALVRRFNAIPLDGVTDTREPKKPQPAELRSTSTRRPKDRAPESAILLPTPSLEMAQRTGTWSAIFDRKSLAANFPVLAWVAMLLCMQAVGWAFFGPILRVLPDRGAALARPLILLLVCWLLWFFASYRLAKNLPGTAFTIFGVLAVVAALNVKRQWREWLVWWPQGRGTIFRIEAVFWTAFAFFLVVRSLNPDLWHPFWGGEKPMEMTYLYGVIKSETFPPLNPWYAGGFINYYYFGFVLCGTMIKALGVLPEVGFNLCLATFFGLACSITMSAARALRPTVSWLTAWSATAFVMCFGNLFELRFIWKRLVILGQPDHELSFPLVSDTIRAVHGLSKVLHGTPLSAYAADLYWVSARAIGGEEVAPVTEFPYWSFVYGDLHPHLIALTYTLGVIVLLAAWIRTQGWKLKAGLGALLGLTLGFFWPTNTWDWPTYGALTGLVLFLAFWQRDKPNLKGFTLSLIKAIAVFMAVLAAGYLAFLPFHQHYVAGYGAFQRWPGPRTSLLDYLFIYGFFLFVLGSRLIAAWQNGELTFLRGLRLWARVVRRLTTRRLDFATVRLVRFAMCRPQSVTGALLGLLLGFLALVTLTRGLLPAFIVAGIVLSLFALWQRRDTPARALPALLALIAFGLSLVVEFIVLVGDVGRMNTVFKFYYQVWVCFALAASLALPAVLAATKGWARRARGAWLMVFGVLVIAASLFPLMGTPAKIRDRFVKTPPTLDGLAFAEKATYELEGISFPLAPDLHAIRWVQDNIKGSPTILEMNTDPRLYSWGSRFATHTGLPTVVGWSWHQRQQQAGLARDRVEERIDDVRRIYRTADLEVARSLLAKYAVQLVIVGKIERIYGTPEGIEKFEKMGWDKIYDREGVVIYRVSEPRPTARLQKGVTPASDDLLSGRFLRSARMDRRLKSELSGPSDLG